LSGRAFNRAAETFPTFNLCQDSYFARRRITFAVCGVNDLLNFTRPFVLLFVFEEEIFFAIFRSFLHLVFS